MYLLTAISILALALLWAVIRGRAAEVKDPRSASEVLRDVDLEAFRNLIDAGQEEVLRQRLSRGEFRRIHRARVLAIAGYLLTIAYNASVFLRAGEAARENHDPAVAAMGAALASSAINLRVNCILALAYACAGYLLPDLGMSIESIVDRYDRLSASLRTVGRTWTPASTTV